MDKKTIIINIILIFLICAIGIGFASFVYFHSTSRQQDSFVPAPPKKDIPFLSFQPIIDNKVSSYQIEISLIKQNDLKFDYSFQGSIQVLNELTDYTNMETNEVITQDMFDIYGFFQSYIKDGVSVVGDHFLFDLKKTDQTRLLNYLTHFVSFPISSTLIQCEAMYDADNGYLLEIICIQGDFYFVFVFDFEE